MNKIVNVAIMGIGTVGGGTYEILTKNHDFLLKTQGIDFRVKKVLDKNLERIRSFDIPDDKAAASVDEIAADKDISVVVETMGGVEPAKTSLRARASSPPTRSWCPSTGLHWKRLPKRARPGCTSKRPAWAAFPSYARSRRASRPTTSVR